MQIQLCALLAFMDIQKLMELALLIYVLFPIVMSVKIQQHVKNV